MRVTLDIPDRLAELLRTLAAQRGVSVESLGEQALAVGLTTLATEAGDTVDVDVGGQSKLGSAGIRIDAPQLISGSLRPLVVTFETDEATNAD